MRKLVYYAAVTLDGFIAGPDGGDPTGQSYFPLHPDLIEFIATEFPETLTGRARHSMGIDGPGRHFDTALEGRGSYEIGLAAGITNGYPHLRHLVFSTTMGQSPDPTLELVADDPLQTARRLKAEDGLDIQPQHFRPTDLRQLDSGIRVLTFDRRDGGRGASDDDEEQR